MLALSDYLWLDKILFSSQLTKMLHLLSTTANYWGQYIIMPSLWTLLWANIFFFSNFVILKNSSYPPPKKHVKTTFIFFFNVKSFIFNLIFYCHCSGTMKCKSFWCICLNFVMVMVVKCTNSFSFSAAYPGPGCKDNSLSRVKNI